MSAQCHLLLEALCAGRLSAVAADELLLGRDAAGIPVIGVGPLIGLGAAGLLLDLEHQHLAVFGQAQGPLVSAFTLGVPRESGLLLGVVDVAAVGEVEEDLFTSPLAGIVDDADEPPSLFSVLHEELDDSALDHEQLQSLEVVTPPVEGQ